MARRYTNSSSSKRYRPDPPTMEDVLFKAREIWNRNPEKARSTMTEEAQFREFFGCGPIVFLKLWNLYEREGVTPDGGTIEHLLWMLFYLKMYPTLGACCSLAGGVDRNTFTKWTTLFIEAGALLEGCVVSSTIVSLYSSSSFQLTAILFFADHF